MIKKILFFCIVYLILPFFIHLSHAETRTCIPDNAAQCSRTWAVDVDGDCYHDGLIRQPAHANPCFPPADDRCYRVPGQNRNTCIPVTMTLDSEEGCNSRYPRAPGDRLPDVHPGAVEICYRPGDPADTNWDEDCNGDYAICVDEERPDVDNDGDGFSENEEDCNDDNRLESPGNASESTIDNGCSNGLDDDCDLKKDKFDDDCYNTNQEDDDGDGYCEGTEPCLDDDPEENPDSRVLPGDCDDNPETGANVHPDQAETCDEAEIDENCNGEKNEGCAEVIEEDLDGDGYCEAEVCQDDTLHPGDCNDNDVLIYPGAREICDNLTDDDCDGPIDQADNQCIGEATEDDDDDGYCEADNCRDGSIGGDCDDSNKPIHPNARSECSGAGEKCAKEECDGIDNDCNGLIDEGLEGADEATGVLCVRPGVSDGDDNEGGENYRTSADSGGLCGLMAYAQVPLATILMILFLLCIPVFTGVFVRYKR